MSGLSDLLLTGPISAACALLVLLLLVGIVAREIARDQAAPADAGAVRALNWTVRILQPLVMGLMCLRLLLILN